VVYRLTVTVSAEPGSTVESRTAALAMFEGSVPCFFSMSDLECAQTALWLAFFGHEENVGSCGDAEPWPLCGEHKRLVQMCGVPFWRTWHNLQPTPCGRCGTPLRAERFEPL
jgi:hypothetical protein